MAEEPVDNFKCRDKFLVQSVAIKADRETLNVQQVVSHGIRDSKTFQLTNVQWAHVEKNDKSAIQERKIRVVYLPPGDGQASNFGETSVCIYLTTKAYSTDNNQVEPSPPPFNTPGSRDTYAESSTPTPSIPASKPKARSETAATTGDSPSSELAAYKSKLAAAEARNAELEKQLKEEGQTEEHTSELQSHQLSRMPSSA